jgi:hypothetical protein
MRIASPLSGLDSASKLAYKINFSIRVYFNITIRFNVCGCSRDSNKEVSHYLESPAHI